MPLPQTDGLILVVQHHHTAMSIAVDAGQKEALQLVAETFQRLLVGGVAAQHLGQLIQHGVGGQEERAQPGPEHHFQLLLQDGNSQIHTPKCAL